MDWRSRTWQYLMGGSSILDIFVMSKMAQGVGEFYPKRAYQSTLFPQMEGYFEHFFFSLCRALFLEKLGTNEKSRYFPD